MDIKVISLGAWLGRGGAARHAAAAFITRGRRAGGYHFHLINFVVVDRVGLGRLPAAPPRRALESTTSAFSTPTGSWREGTQ